ncbi:MAG: hypothetical protein A2226_02010 [Candidatus Veblenbacteria bacterium RIFOXYA2_FULL_43_9]|uniref:Prepilin-type N-terminal cleavage/methylation domain-containing protein n=1 Tax=Candidatus Veblenbacteria bacterium RIFOXYA2_FULL_43_9 TaxID=1802425 RepID=A0A1G2Q2J7_9BACT|nr:MAG: hypothetical protein A2226_02010 [Candidatus Veblenbacteria bacterium RIFOXYA2_FULL_43_9]
MSHKEKKLANQGFSTIELLVVMALIIVVVSAAAGIFLYVSRVQKRIMANQRVQGSVRFALETLVRDLHSSEIDYDYYNQAGLDLIESDGVTVVAVEILALRDSSYQPVLYRKNSDTLEVCRGLSCFTEAGTWSAILSDDVQVVSIKYYIVPGVDPFEPCSGVACVTLPSEQPRVTLAFTAQSKDPEPGTSPTVLWLQTTIVSRSYRR